MTNERELIPHLFRTEFSKIVAVITKHFGLQHIEVAEDLASETFLLAAETWGMKGIPENPAGWLYVVAKNKARDYLKRNQLFAEKIAPEIRYDQEESAEKTAIEDLTWSEGAIVDSQLKMMFALCHPLIPREAQVGLALRILCGLGIEEIAEAFLEPKDTINKRLFRARQKLREEQITLDMPPDSEISSRLEGVASTLYLLFNEGYYSATPNTTLRRDLCLDAMRLTVMLINYPQTDLPFVSALMALMCFHASRFDARLNHKGEILLYEEQDRSKWIPELSKKGSEYLQRSAVGNKASKYHLEAAIAYWHSIPETSPVSEKWEQILQLYNQLLQVAYSPVAALNRTYALAKADSPAKALKEALKLNQDQSHFYHALLAELYSFNLQPARARSSLEKAIELAKSDTERELLKRKLDRLNAA